MGVSGGKADGNRVEFRLGQDILLNCKLSKPCFLQIYEVRDNGSVPLFGKEEIYPDPEDAAPMKVGETFQMKRPLQMGRQDVSAYVAIATTEEVEGDLLDALKRGKVQGAWAIGGVEVDVLR
jgi:hypothetical protein